MTVKHTFYKKMLILVIIEIYCKYACLWIGTFQLFLNLLQQNRLSTTPHASYDLNNIRTDKWTNFSQIQFSFYHIHTSCKCELYHKP